MHKFTTFFFPWNEELYGFDKEFVRWDLWVLPIHFGQGKSAKKPPYQDNKQSVSERTALSQGEHTLVYQKSAPFKIIYHLIKQKWSTKSVWRILSLLAGVDLY